MKKKYFNISSTIYSAGQNKSYIISQIKFVSLITFFNKQINLYIQ